MNVPKRGLFVVVVLALWAAAGVWLMRDRVWPPEAAAPIAGLAELPPEALNEVDGFIAALADLPQPVDEARLTELIAAFQARQDALHPPQVADGADFTDPVEGHVTLKLEAAGPYHVLQITRVEETHTAHAGIDGGVDSHRSVFLDKASLRVRADLPGPVYAFTDPNLLLSLPQKDSCLGAVPTGELSVYDRMAGHTVFSAQLPGGTIRADEPVAGGPQLMRFATHREESIDDGQEHHCEVGDWVRKVDAEYEVTCNIRTRQCTLREVSAEVYAGCQAIGGCD
ncbi:hypothetical protein Q9Q94_05085 [Uliginosibacterium sp. 31-16]|uniref:hypothetical protein n=1 Tax=Uliginosibacterium sp. 31-16 TaxID=3068315 RepID=UPI00273EB46A|nr:hypothetical protein [Uliginosibacterium sp. 31-16]MDP5238891.1 hypothetical protein [Uliginosibacterium sp. 31-16]